MERLRLAGRDAPAAARDGWSAGGRPRITRTSGGPSLPEAERGIPSVRPAGSSTSAGRCSRAQLEDRSEEDRGKHRWYGSRRVDDAARGAPRARGGRGGRAAAGQRLWDLAERWYPETESVPPERGGAAARRAALPGDGRPARAGPLARAPRRRGRPRSPTGRGSSRRSTGSCTTATAPRRCSASATGSRCTCRRRSASTATTCCRCSSATGRRSRRAALRPQTGRARGARRMGRHVAARRGARGARERSSARSGGNPWGRLQLTLGCTDADHSPGFSCSWPPSRRRRLRAPRS